VKRLNHSVIERAVGYVALSLRSCVRTGGRHLEHHDVKNSATYYTSEENDSLKYACKYCVYDSICHFKLHEVGIYH